MAIRPILFFATLLLLSGCATSGNNRSYIISDTTQDEISKSETQRR